MLTLSLADRFPSFIRSPLPGVSDVAWKCFVVALGTQSISSVSKSGGLGLFDMRPRRLVELGFARNLRPLRTATGRTVQTCDLVAPWSLTRFLSDPVSQYRVLCDSMLQYQQDLQGNTIEKPRDMSLAGALAVLHRGGRGALKAWPNLFENTRALYLAAQRAF